MLPCFLALPYWPRWAAMPMAVQSLPQSIKGLGLTVFASPAALVPDLWMALR